MTFPLAEHAPPDHHDIKTQSPNTIPLIFCNSAAKLSNYFHSSKHFTKKVRTAKAIRSLSNYRGHLVIWSFVKIEIGLVKIRHYNINILYLYIVINDRVPEIDFDQNDLDQMTGFVCLFLILVDIFLKALTIFLMMLGGVRIML